MTSPVLLRHARIDGAEPTDILIRNEVIERIGPGDVPADADVLDLDGRHVHAGLWDHHVHFAQWAIMRRRLDLSSATSAASAASIIEARLLAELDSAEPLIGFGYRDGLWPDEPTAAVLDAVAPRRPVVLLSGDMHACWVNSAARSRYGLPDAGVLRETHAFALQMRLERAAPGDEDEAVVAAAVAAAARGVVGIVDLEMSHNLDGWTERMTRGLHALRVRSGFYPDDLEARSGAGWRTGDVVDGTAGLLTIGPLKFITDGSLNTRTAYCHDPYPGQHSHGVLTVSPSRTLELLETATAHGFDVAVHAIGDAAVAHALDAFAATGARGTVEHAQLVAHADVPRFAELGVEVSVQPEHLWDDRDVTDVTWPGRSDRAFPFRSLADAGATLLLGSDAPVAPLDPWRAIAAASHRSGDDRAPWHPEQSLTRAEALAAAQHAPGIVVGAPADLVAVDLDPLTASHAELIEMPVTLTMTAGRFTHRLI